MQPHPSPLSASNLPPRTRSPLRPASLRFRTPGSYAAVLSLVLLLGCASSHRKEPGDSQPPGSPAANSAQESVPPNACRVLATVVSIAAPAAGKNPADPCDRIPCTATIRIDSVLAYGPAFPVLLAPAQTLTARFAFTLKPTAGLLPEVRPALPGLTAGSGFEALVHASTPLGSSQPSFVVYSYQAK